MIRIFQYKLYPNQAQIKTLERWLRTCCWLHNQALEMRIKAYRRRGESVSLYTQTAWLTDLRGRIASLRSVPVDFERDALRRVDRGMKAFFRRFKAGNHPGFPRFKSASRWNSMECLDSSSTYLKGDRIRVPNFGTIRCRGRLLPEGLQKGICVIKRATGWYAQIILDDGKQPPLPDKRHVESAIGIDVGLASFATLSDGEQIENPRYLARSSSSVRALQRRVSRRKKGSNRRRKAINALARKHEQVADQRRNFAHQHSTALVRKYDLIAVENLNVAGMVRSRFGKSIHDAGWSIFLSQLRSKAECAGSQLVEVDARYTSQECPNCGAVKPKKLSERTHSCACGLTCHRDHAAAQVILARALAVTGAIRPSMDLAADSALVAQNQASQMKREGRLATR